MCLYRRWRQCQLGTDVNEGAKPVGHCRAYRRFLDVGLGVVMSAGEAEWAPHLECYLLQGPRAGY